MKVYYIKNKYDGCYYVRCLIPLQANAYDGAVKMLGGKCDTNEEMFEKAMKADVIVFQRPDSEDKTKAIALLKQVGKKIVYDNDDTYRPDSGFPKLELWGNRQIIEKVNAELYKNVTQADLVTTTTDFLAKEYEGLNNNVVVLPNCVDPMDWPTPKRNEGKEIRIGLTGSVGYDDFKVILPYLEELAKREDIRLVMFSLSLPKAVNSIVADLYKDSYDFIKSNRIEWHTHVPIQDYMTKLNDLKLDIMLIPRRETYFNKCKSNLKYLEAGMLEIPCVCSSFSDGNSPYDKDITNRVNGFLASNEEEFRQHTEELIADKELRLQIGKNAKNYVLRYYDINNNYHLWDEEYKKICDK